MNRYEDNMCQAISTIANHAVENAKYDRTIIGSIQKCEDEGAGKYKIKYQDSFFYAFTLETDIKYEKNTNVYILIPGNDMSKDKIILASLDRVETKYTPVITKDADFDYIGTLLLQMTQPLYASSYSPNNEKKTYYLYNKNTSENLIQVNQKAFDYYINNCNYLALGGTFTADIPDFNGNYELVFEFEIEDSLVPLVYSISKSDMTGNIYHCSNQAQYGIFEINTEETGIFKSLKSIYLTVEGFSNSIENVNDLIISDINFSTLEKRPDSGYYISFSAPYSFWFGKYADLKITPSLLLDKQPVAASIEYKWFERKGSVSGGWLALAANNFTLEIPHFYSESKRIKCVAYLNGTEEVLCERIIDLKNFNEEENKVFITAQPNAAIFYKGSSNPNLICNTTYEDNNLSYYWSMDDNKGNLIDVNTIGDVNNNILSNINIELIKNYANFICSVYKENDLLSTAYFKMIVAETSQGIFTLVLLNGTQDFIYNKNGQSPTSAAVNSITIQPLSFVLYDNNGNEIPTIGEWIWKIPPADKSLLDKFYDMQGNEIIPEIKDDNYRFITNQKQFTYTINDIFDYSKTNNNIELQVPYKGYTYIETTSFNFSKDGNLTSTTSNYTIKIKNASLDDLEDLGNKQIIYTYNTSTKKGHYNFTPYLNYMPFMLYLYRDGEYYLCTQSFSSNQEVSLSSWWYLLKNTYSDTLKDESDFKMRDSSGGAGIDFVGTTDTSPANILWCKAIVRELSSGNTFNLSATLPIVVFKTNSDEYELQIEGGLKDGKVVYDKEGLFPQYDIANKYNIILKRKDGTVVEVEDDKISYSVYGKVFNKDVQNLSIKTDNLSFSITPAAYYNGLCTNNGVCCTIEGIGSIYIPIHLTLSTEELNRFFGWNGNVANIKSHRGFLLQPQVAMGSIDSGAPPAYSGVFMGSAYLPNKTYEEKGLMGFYEGSRFFNLNENELEIGAEEKDRIFYEPYRGSLKLNLNGTEGKTTLNNEEGYRAYDSNGNLKFYILPNGTIRILDGDIGPFSCSSAMLYYMDDERQLVLQKSGIKAGTSSISSKGDIVVKGEALEDYVKRLIKEYGGDSSALEKTVLSSKY